VSLCFAVSVDKPQKVLDFGKKSILNTSLMHSGGAKARFLTLLVGIFQVIDFKEK
jgi:hypothetical protein